MVTLDHYIEPAADLDMVPNVSSISAKTVRRTGPFGEETGQARWAYRAEDERFSLHRASGERTQAAKMLGIPRSRFYRRMWGLGIDLKNNSAGVDHGVLILSACASRGCCLSTLSNSLKADGDRHFIANHWDHVGHAKLASVDRGFAVETGSELARRAVALAQFL